MRRVYSKLIESTGSLIDAIRSKANLRLSSASAKELLSDVDNHFYINEGPAVRNLYELMYTMRDLSDEQLVFQ